MNRMLKDIESAYGPEAAQLVKDCCSVARAKIVARDLFGWREFIDDVISDMALWIINEGFMKQRAGRYVSTAMQLAIDKARYCSAACRRGNYELVSLDDLFQVADETPDTADENEEFLFDIEIAFGKAVRDELEPFVTGKVDKISKAVKAKLNTPEFRKFLEERRK